MISDVLKTFGVLIGLSIVLGGVASGIFLGVDMFFTWLLGSSSPLLAFISYYTILAFIGAIIYVLSDRWIKKGN